MLADKKYCGMRFRIEVLPDEEIILHCLGDDRKETLKLKDMAICSKELYIKIDEIVYKFIAMCGVWILVGEFK